MVDGNVGGCRREFQIGKFSAYRHLHVGKTANVLLDGIWARSVHREREWFCVRGVLERGDRGCWHTIKLDEAFLVEHHDGSTGQGLGHGVYAEDGVWGQWLAAAGLGGAGCRCVNGIASHYACTAAGHPIEIDL